MFYLKDKKKAVTAIEAIVSISGKKYKYATGQSVDPDQWTGNRAKYTKKHPEGKNINEALEKIEKAVEAATLFFKDRKQPTPAEFRNKVNEGVKYGTSDLSFIDAVERFYKSKNYRYETKKKYITAINKLEAYQESTGRVLYFDDITIDFYRDFRRWFYRLEKAPGVPYSKNYFGSIIKVIRKVMVSGLEGGLHTNRGFQHSEFTVEQEAAESVYLSESELKQIYALDITPQKVAAITKDKRPHNIAKKAAAMRRVRDRFLIGAYTALRVSDFNRLNASHFADGFLRISTKKTQKPVVVPVHPVVKEIVGRGGLDYRISEQKINKHIKEVCQLAGIDAPVVKNTTRAGASIETTQPKYKLISSHTGRRSAATNMFKAGIPAISIMKITGHTTENSFMKYIRITQEENAELLKNHPYFK